VILGTHSIGTFGYIIILVATESCEGDFHTCPDLPRPPVCSSAETTVNSKDESPRLFSSLFVESIESKYSK
jgi:hypothetical protein